MNDIDRQWSKYSTIFLNHQDANHTNSCDPQIYLCSVYMYIFFSGDAKNYFLTKDQPPLTLQSIGQSTFWGMTVPIIYNLPAVIWGMIWNIKTTNNRTRFKESLFIFFSSTVILNTICSMWWRCSFAFLLQWFM